MTNMSILSKLNGNTIRLFNDFIRIEQLRLEYPTLSERKFIIEVLGLTTSTYYRKRARVLKNKELFEEYSDYINTNTNKG